MLVLCVLLTVQHEGRGAGAISQFLFYYFSFSVLPVSGRTL